MRRHLKRSIAVLGSLLIALGALAISFTPALASPRTTDPMVVIAQDTTTLSSCTMITATSNGTDSSPCPAGSVITTAHVLLSQALAANEAYVLLPPKSISSAEAAKVTQQIQDLMRAKADHIHQHTGAIKPFIAGLPNTCRIWSELSKSASWHPGFDLNTTFLSIVDYQVNGLCSLNMEYSEIDLQKIGGPTYWDHDQYTSSYWDWGCQSLPSGWTTHGPGGNFEAAGYYYEQWVYNGSNCFPWDYSSYIDIGPLTNG
jgi:hypothetical protein